MIVVTDLRFARRWFSLSGLTKQATRKEEHRERSGKFQCNEAPSHRNSGSVYYANVLLATGYGAAVEDGCRLQEAVANYLVYLAAEIFHTLPSLSSLNGGLPSHRYSQHVLCKRPEQLIFHSTRHNNIMTTIRSREKESRMENELSCENELNCVSVLSLAAGNVQLQRGTR
jgi:hypothetical protein